MATLTRKLLPAARKTEPLDAKKAVMIAMNYFEEFFRPQVPKPNVMLEELEENSAAYLVTLGYDTPNRETRGLMDVRSDVVRAYKLFTIDATSGRVRSVKIRKV